MDTSIREEKARHISLAPADAAFYALNAAIFIYLFMKGYRVLEDSGSYINHSVIRTPAYPVFLDLFKYIAGGSYLTAVYIFQIALGFFAALTLTGRITRVFNAGGWTRAAVYMVLMSPFYGPNGIANNIMSESPAYSFFMLAAAFFIDGLESKKPRDIFSFFAMAVITALVRPQFLFLYAFAAIYIVFTALQTREYLKNFLMLVLLIAMIAAAGLGHRSYNYFRHGKFTGIPFTGIQALTQALYVSGSDEISLFSGEKETAYLRAVFTKLDGAKATSAYNNPPNFIEYPFHYSQNYNVIAWNTVAKTYREQFTRAASFDEMSIDEIIAFDKFTCAIAFKLLRKNCTKFARLFIANILKGSGGYFYFILVAFMFALTFARYMKNKHIAHLAAFFIILMNYMNYSLVALVEPAMTRYTFYTDALLLAALIALAARSDSAPGANISRSV